MPLSLHPLFKPYDTGCPVSKEIRKTFITLPLHADLTEKEIDYVIEALEKCESIFKL